MSALIGHDMGRAGGLQPLALCLGGNDGALEIVGESHTDHDGVKVRKQVERKQRTEGLGRTPVTALPVPFYGKC